MMKTTSRALNTNCIHEFRLLYYCKPNSPHFFVRAECVHCGNAGELTAIKQNSTELTIKQKRAIETANDASLKSVKAGLIKAKD